MIIDVEKIKKIAFCWHWESPLVAWAQSEIDESLILQYADGYNVLISGAWLSEVGWSSAEPLVYYPINNRCLMTSENECSIDCSDCQFGGGGQND